MSSKHTHAYSNYVNHILNNSPTKITYTFPKSQRFLSPKKQKEAPLDLIIQTFNPSSNKKNLTQNQKFKLDSHARINNFIDNQKQHSSRFQMISNIKNQINKQRSENQIKEPFPIQKYLNNQIIRSQSYNKKLSKSKSTKMVKFADNIRVSSPFEVIGSPKKKKKVWNKGENNEKFLRKRLYTMNELNEYQKKDNILPISYLVENNNIINNKYLKYSPYNWQNLKINDVGQQNNLFKQKLKDWKNNSLQKLNLSKQTNKHKRVKTTNVILQQLNHPSKNITVQGYYPLGTQINPKGKYVPSTYKNIPSHTFGNPQTKNEGKPRKSPNKNQARRKSKQKGDYSSDKKNIVLPNGSELYPYTHSFYHHLTQKKQQKQKKRIEQLYNPFSQFGNVNAFRY